MLRPLPTIFNSIFVVMLFIRHTNILPILTAFFIMLIIPIVNAEIWTYPVPDKKFTSSQYAVRVIQAETIHDSFVYQHENQDNNLKPRMSDYNHWTSFSFSGSITVEVEATKYDLDKASLRPSSRNIKINKLGKNKISFSLDRPEKLWLKVPGAEEDPLFIFADAPEKNIPDRKDENVIWFDAGKVHDIGERFEIKSNTTVYIPGGAYVRGTITANNSSNIRIAGRGILSGLGYARRPSYKGIPYNSVMFNGDGKNQLVEGITITNPQHFCILSRGEITTRNVKLFGWWHQTDGWGGGDNSIVEDSFFKVNDDIVKFYGANQVARNLVIYQQVNGAVLQLGWSGANAKNVLMENVDIIRVENKLRGNSENNTAVLNLRSQRKSDTVVGGVTLRNVRIEDDVTHLVGLGEVYGEVKNIQLENVDILGKLLYQNSNYVRTFKNGKVKNIRFKNVRANGEAIEANKKSPYWSTSGNVNF